MIGTLVGLLCAITWAMGSILMKELSHKLDPITLNAPRALVGGLLMLTIVFLTGRQEGYAAVTPLQLFFMLGSMAIGGGVGDALYVLSLSRIGVSRAFPIASTYPALTLLLGVLFLGEAVRLEVVGGLVLVTLGIALISQVSTSTVDSPRSLTSEGTFLALGAALCWAVSMLMVAPGIQGHDPILVASIRVPALAAALWSIALVRGSWRQLAILQGREWVILVVGGLIGWGLGSMLFVQTVALIGPAQAAIITSTSPMFALPLSAIFLRERLNKRVVGGTVLTIIGVILVSLAG